MRASGISLAPLLAALFPPACVACGRAGEALCAACRPAPAAAARGSYGGLEVRALGPYEGTLRRAVLALKAGRRDVGAILGTLLAERFGPGLEADALLVAVPTSGARRLARGFDQAALLTRAVAQRTGLPSAAALGRRGGEAQQGRTRRERLSAGGRFLCLPGVPLAGRRIVLVDDVVTTGATLADCGAVLREAGATVRAALVVAQTCIAERERGVLGSASNEGSTPCPKPSGTTPSSPRATARRSSRETTIFRARA
jgi:ComF family protein